jgi:hypothetical protein
MKVTSKIMLYFGAFLILAGVLGFLSNPEKAKTALMSGGLFGFIAIALGVLARRGWQKALPISIGLTMFLAITFTWRAIVSWMAYWNGQADKFTAAVLISTMLVGSATVATVLFLRANSYATQRPLIN